MGRAKRQGLKPIDPAEEEKRKQERKKEITETVENRLNSIWIGRGEASVVGK